MKRFLLFLCFASVAMGDIMPPSDRIVGPNGATVNVSTGNVALNAGSGGQVNVTNGDTYIPTILHFSPCPACPVSSNPGAAFRYNNVTGKLELSIDGATYVALGSATIPSTTDLLVGNGSGNAAALGSGTNVKTFLQTPTRANLHAAVTNETDVIEIFDDLLRVSPVFFAGSNSGSGTSPTTTGGTLTRFGVWTLGTATSATGASFFNDNFPGANAWFFGGTGETIFETGILIPTLSDGTETFTVRCGWNDANAADGTDGIYFRYTHGENSGKWVLVGRSNTTETATNSNSTVAAATWYKLRIVVNSAATSAEFYVNGTSIGTVASNIPTGLSRATGPLVSIAKSAGTTNRSISCDYIYLKKVLTAGR